MVSVLMVAEKPSIATSIAQALVGANQLENLSRSPPLYEFPGRFQGKDAFIKVTSVTGHLFSTDFPSEYQRWDAIEPLELFGAPVVSLPTSEGVVKHLQRVAVNVDHLVLWLDCDREGENICFEVIRVVDKYMNKNKKIHRAKFSAVTAKDIEKALSNLGYPNENESKAVEARQELDLKIGVAFSRYQTNYFRGKYGDLDSTVISYGPCQTPTLSFCVDRHDEIQIFTSEMYYTIDAVVDTATVNIPLQWSRNRLFDQSSVEMFHIILKRESTLLCVSSKSYETKRTRPKPLNTVELLKIASKILGIGPQAAMRAAEYLYLSGYLSYPRTESTSYPKSFDIRDALSVQCGNQYYGDVARDLIRNGFTPPLLGHDAGDHPPITPVGLAVSLSGDNARIYDLVVRHFLATVSEDAVYLVTELRFQAEICKESFTATKKIEINPGFLAIYDRQKEDKEDVGQQDLPDVKAGSHYKISSLRIRSGTTSPPGHLTESELISLMEKHGIGTDASIPTHINNIMTRNYVTLGPGRSLIPTTLGIVLVHGYKRIDPDLVYPAVRAAIETFCNQIAKGLSQKENIVTHSLKIFESKFKYFMKHIEAMDSIFEASFSPLAATGSYLSKCGKCLRYMRFIPLKPQRLYCPKCEESYALPQNGTIKLYKELKCPLDNFELLLFSLGNSANAQGKSYSLCPYCYNNPPSFEEAAQSSPDMSKRASDAVKTAPAPAVNMGCNQCLHPTCKNSAVVNQLCGCPGVSADTGKPCDGMLVLDVNSKPNWKLACNKCNTLLRFKAEIHEMRPAAKSCEDCGLRLATFEFNKLKTPLKDGKTSYTGCLSCDDFLNELTELVTGRTLHVKIVNQIRGSRGRGRGKRR